MKLYPSVVHANTSKLRPVIGVFEPKHIDKASNSTPPTSRVRCCGEGCPLGDSCHGQSPERVQIHPVRIARFHVPRFSPRVGLPRNLCFIGSGVRSSKGWVQKDENLRTRIGCSLAMLFIYWIAKF